MAGESYGVRTLRLFTPSGLSDVDVHQGRYVPTYAAAVYDQNAKLIEAGATPINISSIMVGAFKILRTFAPSVLMLTSLSAPSF